jgi:hypothetical protein
MFGTVCSRRPHKNQHLNPAGEKILTHLAEVAALRARRDSSPAWADKLRQVKEFQHRRFEATYADLLVQPRYARAAQFFLQELYGPGDFSARDQQFARVVPALVRLFPDDIVVTVALLSQLHALSEKLDNEMADSLQGAPNDAPLSPHSYAQAWRRVGQPARREEQIALTLQVGAALDRFTRKTLLRQSLRLMRVPARRAGLGALQTFLEAGFDTFRDMGGADYFLDTVARRERALAAELFAGGEPRI